MLESIKAESDNFNKVDDSNVYPVALVLCNIKTPNATKVWNDLCGREDTLLRLMGIYCLIMNKDGFILSTDDIRLLSIILERARTGDEQFEAAMLAINVLAKEKSRRSLDILISVLNDGRVNPRLLYEVYLAANKYGCYGLEGQLIQTINFLPKSYRPKCNAFVKSLKQDKGPGVRVP